MYIEKRKISLHTEAHVHTEIHSLKIKSIIQKV